jgi:hypothetical protein
VCLYVSSIAQSSFFFLIPLFIVQLANFVARAWESNPGQERVNELAKLMTNLLHSTLLCGEKSFDEALKQFCRNNVPTHTVSPSITLLIAIGYIQRLKQVNDTRLYSCNDLLIHIYRDTPISKALLAAAIA